MFTNFFLPLLLGTSSQVNFSNLKPNIDNPPLVEPAQIPQPKKSDKFFFRALASLIGKVESQNAGDYNAANAGYPGDLGSNGLVKISGRDCSRITLGELKNWQRRGLLYAVGRYQMIPRTFKAAQSWADLKDHEYFTPENQDKMLVALLKFKRPSVWAFIQGKGSINEAVSALAREWAGLPGLNGYSFYSNGNKAHTSISSLKSALMQDRQAYAQYI